MPYRFAPIAALSAIAMLTACSEAPEDAPANQPEPELPTSVDTAPAPSPERTIPPGTDVLSPQGLGLLVVGKPIPQGSSFAVRGAQASDSCLIASSPDFPDVYVIEEDGVVKRITASQGAKLELASGVRVGMDEAEARMLMGTVREVPHKYADAPAKYLFETGSDPHVMVEIGADGTVTQLHVGTMPALGYVEACS